MKKLLFLLLLFNTILCFSLETGYASWYGGKFHGRFTASGEVYDMNKLTAAHKTLPFGTFVQVLNIENGKSIIVKINDRGPFVEGRIIDLSKAAAEKIGMLKNGVAKVLIKAVSINEDKKSLHSVQIGSYSNPENAVRLKTLFEEKGFEVFIEKSTQGFHRVIIDNIKEDDLSSILKELTDLGFIHVLVKKK